MLKRLHIDSQMRPVPYLGDGFRGVRKLEVTNVLPQALRLMLESMPSVDWLSLLDRAYHPGSLHEPDHLFRLCKVVGSVKPALRHLAIDEEHLEENFTEALYPIRLLTELRTLVLRLGGETYVNPALLRSLSKLKYVHIDVNLDDSGLRARVARAASLLQGEIRREWPARQARRAAILLESCGCASRVGWYGTPDPAGRQTARSRRNLHCGALLSDRPAVPLAGR